MNPKTIFFDIDGTLLGTRDGKRFQIPPSALEALGQWNATVIAELIAQGRGGLDPAGAGVPAGAGQ